MTYARRNRQHTTGAVPTGLVNPTSPQVLAPQPVAYATPRQPRKSLPMGRILIGVAIAGLGAFGASAYFGESGQQFRADQAAAKAITNERRFNSMATEWEQEDRAAAIEEANSRYLQACLMPFEAVEQDGQYVHQVTTITEGMVIHDPNTGRTLADGQLVCDDRGMTGMFAGGVVTDLKRADTPDLWNRRFQDYAEWNPLARRSQILAVSESNMSQRIADQAAQDFVDGNIQLVTPTLPGEVVTVD